jgi:hypothetical protein
MVDGFRGVIAFRHLPLARGVQLAGVAALGVFRMDSELNRA